MRTLRTPHSCASLAFPVALLALLLAAALALPACGHDETASGTTPTGSPSPAASPSLAEAYGEITPSPSPSASGARMAVFYSRPPYPPTEAFAAATVGWQFKPTVDIEVTDLGCFDAYQDGLARSHRVGIFDAHTDRLIASVTVRPKSALDGAFRWESLEVPVVLKAGHSYVVGTETKTAHEGRGGGAHETLYAEEAWAEEWAPQIDYGGLRTNMGSDSAFSAPTDPRRGFAMVPIAWMSPNFKFERVVRLTGEADNPTHLDAPGTASAAQTEAVARRYAAALGARKMVGAGLYATDATLDENGFCVGVTWGAKSIKAFWYDRYHGDPGDPRDSWSRDYHLLVAPGIAVWEGSTRDAGDAWRWRLALLAVNGGKIAHEEVYSGENGLDDTWRMAFCDTPPGPNDTAEAASRVAAAVGEAFATRDLAALEALLARDVIFPEMDDRPGVSGRKALLRWWDMLVLVPKKAAKIVVKNEAPMAGPGWAVVRWTARRIDRNFIFPDGCVVSANMATVVEVRGGKVVRIVPYGSAEGGESGLLAP